MIDFLKLSARSLVLAEQLQKHPELSFYDYCNKAGYRVGVQAQCEGWTFRVYPSGRVEVEGSIHHYYNVLRGNDSVNWDDFTRLDLYDTLHEFSERFGLCMKTMRIENVEFGVNLRLPDGWAVPDTLRQLIAYKTIPFKNVALKKPGWYVEAILGDYYIKAYDKSAHQNQPEPILRFEVKARRMKKTPTINYLSDLLDTAKLDTLGKLLVKTFEGCFWAEPFDIAQLSISERGLVERAHRVDTWKAMSRNQRYELRTKYNELALRHNHQLRATLGKLLNEKVEQLLQLPDVLRRGASHKPKGRFTDLDIAVSCQDNKTVGGQRQEEEREVVSLPSAGVESVVLLLPPPSAIPLNRYCPVSGFDISHQPERTRFLSTASVRKLYDDDRPAFDALALRYLTAKQKRSDLATRCYHIAHNIRNAATNSRNNLRRRVEQQTNCKQGFTLPLFAPTDALLLSEERRELLTHFENTQLDVLRQTGIRSGTSFTVAPRARGGAKKRRYLRGSTVR